LRTHPTPLKVTTNLSMPKAPADQFSDDEMAQVKRFGQALGGAPTDFDEEVEKHLARYAKAAKPTVPTDESDSEQDAEGQKAENQSQAIANVADFSNVPEIPASTAPQTVAPPKPSPPSSKPPFEELGS
jgi:hypothetical protein